MTPELWLCVAAGFIAQVIDGALGMAYGVTASSLLLTFGLSPVVTSATVHAAECFTTGASAISHHAFENIDRSLFRRLRRTSLTFFASEAAHSAASSFD